MATIISLFFFLLVLAVSLVSTVDSYNLGEYDTKLKEKVNVEIKSFQRLILLTISHNFPREFFPKIQTI